MYTESLESKEPASFGTQAETGALLPKKFLMLLELEVDSDSLLIMFLSGNPLAVSLCVDILIAACVN